MTSNVEDTKAVNVFFQYMAMEHPVLREYPIPVLIKLFNDSMQADADSGLLLREVLELHSTEAAEALANRFVQPKRPRCLSDLPPTFYKIRKL